MNNTKTILDSLLKQSPQTVQEKYIFLVGNNEHLYKQIMAAHYIAFQIESEQLIAYLDNQLNSESHIKDFIWVACAGKTENDSLNAFFEREGIPYKQGWRMIKQLGDNPADEVVNSVIERFTALPDSAKSKIPTNDEHKPHNTNDYIDRMLFADIEKMKSAGSHKTGFPELDEKSNGLYTGLYVIAATSSLGKTTFALQIADNLAASGKDVLFFSLEQSRLELISKSFSRLWAQNGNKVISSLTFRNGRYHDELKKAIDLYKEKFSNHMNIIEGNFGCNVDYVEAYVKEYIAKNSCSPVIIVDYLQILQPSTFQKSTSTREAIDQNVTALKRLSRDYGLTVFVISSINRSNYMQPIDFESLKESGGIEYTADVVWGLQLQCLSDELFNKRDKIKEKRDLIKMAKARNPRQIELVCLKNRYGVSNFSCEFEYWPQCDIYEQKTSGCNNCYDAPFEKRN